MNSGSVIGFGLIEIAGDFDKRGFSGGVVLKSRLEMSQGEYEVR